ncbi:CCR4-NOT transcription complex subunit 9 [Triticum aestivum]|uniref:CCR4-NOT transcription complex subunit 9 n=1 Tax=Triticum aestivum TaxID=4565 RepID=UPI001D02E2EB|nr:CCR4-NOT transcription complex subunit 9-like [Triticum aestivum]
MVVRIRSTTSACLLHGLVLLPSGISETRDFSRPCSTAVALLWHCCCTAPAHIPLYLYPFLNTTSKTRPFEYLRLTSLGVIGALVKVN